MERTFTRASRSSLQPVEIGKRLVRAMESEQSVGVEGILVPNVYDVFLSRDNDIVLDDKRVSRHHAEFVSQGTRWIMRDTGSTNGTAVNGQVVREAVLKPGDQISLGGLEVRWEQ